MASWKTFVRQSASTKQGNGCTVQQENWQLKNLAEKSIITWRWELQDLKLKVEEAPDVLGLLYKGEAEMTHYINCRFDYG